MAISKVIRKYAIDAQPKDFSFWQSKSYEQRIEALEQIRKEYNSKAKPPALPGRMAKAMLKYL